MQYANITPAYAVAAQIEPGDLTAVAEAGFTTVICNRPDAEVPSAQGAANMRAAAEAAGLQFVDNPVDHSGLTMETIAAQGAAIDGSAGPVFAYCRTGTRSSVVWALSQAGKSPADDLLAACRAAGYDFPMLKAQIDAIAQR